MKIITAEEETLLNQVVAKGAIVGAAAGLTATLAASFLAQRHWPAYARMTLPFKAFLATSFTSCACVIQAERKLLQFDKERHSVPHIESAKRLEQEQGMRKVTLSRYLLSEIDKNKWGIIGSTWVGGMGLSGLYLYAQKHMSATQKFVQARMYAQALTIAALLATAAVSIALKDNEAGNEDDKEWWQGKSQHDDSWKRVIEKSTA